MYCVMARIDANIPDDLEIRIQSLVDEGEFEDYDSAVQQLLSSGLTAYRTGGSTDDDEFGSEFDDDFGTAEPAGHDDDYVF